MEKGTFIVFEGIDGSGKSTQLALLAEYLRKSSKYNHVLLTREPYKERDIREILSRDKNPYSKSRKLTGLFVQDRIEHLRNMILPSLTQGILVLCDRYKLSTFAYQAAQGEDIEYLIELQKDFQSPDLTFIVDLPANLVAERVSKSGFSKEGKFESSLEFQEKVRNFYLRATEFYPGEKIKILDGTKSIEALAEEVRAIVKRELNL